MLCGCVVCGFKNQFTKIKNQNITDHTASNETNKISIKIIVVNNIAENRKAQKQKEKEEIVKDFLHVAGENK